MGDKTSADFEPLVSRNQHDANVQAALRLYLGRGRRYTVKQVANATGVADRVIECAMAKMETGDFRSLPVHALLSISGFLGASFTSEWLAPAALAAIELPDGEEELPPGVFAADVSADSTEVVRRAADGEFCSEDRAALAQVGHRKIARGLRLVAAAKAA